MREEGYQLAGKPEGTSENGVSGGEGGGRDEVKWMCFGRRM